MDGGAAHVIQAAIRTPRVRASRLVAGVVAALALFAAAPSAAVACDREDANPNDVSLATVDATTVCLLNEERGRHGVRPLRRNSQLDRASRRHAVDMVRRDYFAHGDFVRRIRAVDYLRGASAWLVAENIAWGSYSYATPRSIVRQWMNSPGHRANILNGRLREVGVGIARGAPRGGVQDAATYVTDFGTRR
jgi:uncharacterized protein YkwD